MRADLAMTRIDASLFQDGVERTWHAEVPPSAGSGRPTALIVVLHGAGSEGPRYLDMQGWAEVARREEVIVVAPDALPPDPTRPARFRDNPRIWNSGKAKPGETRPQMDEGEFIRHIEDDLRRRGIVIDPARRYLVGHSNGAALTWKLLAEEPERWVAGVSVAGGLVNLPPRNGPPRPLFAIFGGADPLVPLAGGEVGLLWGQTRTVPPVLETLGHWAASEGLSSTPATSGPDDGITRYSWGPLLTAIVVHGQGHEWPGGGSSGLPTDIIGPQTTHFDATGEAWRFLKKLTS
jgi:polyhydroxybutyrate depolymerase